MAQLCRIKMVHLVVCPCLLLFLSLSLATYISYVCGGSLSHLVHKLQNAEVDL